jgi:hypothetical protein
MCFFHISLNLWNTLKYWRKTKDNGNLLLYYLHQDAHKIWRSRFSIKVFLQLDKLYCSITVIVRLMRFFLFRFEHIRTYTNSHDGHLEDGGRWLQERKLWCYLSVQQIERFVFVDTATNSIRSVTSNRFMLWTVRLRKIAVLIIVLFFMPFLKDRYVKKFH